MEWSGTERTRCGQSPDPGGTEQALSVLLVNGDVRTVNGDVRTVNGDVRTVNGIIRTVNGIIRTVKRRCS